MLYQRYIFFYSPVSDFLSCHRALVIRDGPLFFPGGYRDWEKKVCTRKNAEINCLPQVHLEKIVCRDHLRYARFGEFKTKLSPLPKWREKACKHSINGEKNFCPL